MLLSSVPLDILGQKKTSSFVRPPTLNLNRKKLEVQGEETGMSASDKDEVGE
jgi:hypothetical protein